MSQTVTGAYIAEFIDLIDKINTLKAAAEDHFNTHPDSINWGHVGTLTKINSDLCVIMQFAGVKV